MAVWQIPMHTKIRMKKDASEFSTGSRVGEINAATGGGGGGKRWQWWE